MFPLRLAVLSGILLGSITSTVATKARPPRGSSKKRALESKSSEPENFRNSVDFQLSDTFMTTNRNDPESAGDSHPDQKKHSKRIFIEQEILDILADLEEGEKTES